MQTSLIQIIRKRITVLNGNEFREPGTDGLLGAIVDATHAHGTVKSKARFSIAFLLDVILGAIIPASTAGSAVIIGTKLQSKQFCCRWFYPAQEVQYP